MPSTVSTSSRQGFSLKRLLTPLLTRPKVAFGVKCVVYGILLYNFGQFFLENVSAYNNSLPANAPLDEILETFSDTIDTLAWLGLVFLLELETNVLSDDVLDSWLGSLLRVIRLACCVLIAYAAYGYTAEALKNFEFIERTDISSLCDLADDNIALQVETAEFSKITPENCEQLSSNPPFMQIKDKVSLIDEKTLLKVQKVDFIDVVNAFVWLIVVALIEIEIRLQWSDQFGAKLQRVQQVKFACYGVLWLCVIAWWYGGYILYGVDAMVWIAGFWAIELNLAHWEEERRSELQFDTA